MRILGLSAYYHDSAACLVEDGVIVAAAQEERFTRRKHDAAFPRNAARYCLAEGRRRAPPAPPASTRSSSTTSRSSSSTASSRSYFSVAPRGLSQYLQALPLWLRDRLWVAPEIDGELRGLGIDKPPPVHFTEHHESHAASAFYPSPFDEAAILTLDGVGEWSTTTVGVGEGGRLRADRGDALPALARPALLGVHLLHRLSRQLRRVQADGSRALRRAGLPRPHPRPPGRPARPTARSGSISSYFDYCRRLADDEPPLRRALRRPAALAGVADHAARDGSGALDPGGDRGDRAPAGAPCPRADRQAQPLPRRRRGAELRGERPPAALADLRRHLDPAGRRRRRRRGRRGARLPLHGDV